MRTAATKSTRASLSSLTAPASPLPLLLHPSLHLASARPISAPALLVLVLQQGDLQSRDIELASTPAEGAGVDHDEAQGT